MNLKVIIPVLLVLSVLVYLGGAYPGFVGFILTLLGTIAFFSIVTAYELWAVIQSREDIISETGNSSVPCYAEFDRMSGEILKLNSFPETDHLAESEAKIPIGSPERAREISLLLVSGKKPNICDYQLQ